MNKFKVTLGICFLITVVICNIVFAQNNIINEESLNESIINEISENSNSTTNFEKVESNNIVEEAVSDDEGVIEEDINSMENLQNTENDLIKSEQALENGVYEILSTINSNIAFDITDGLKWNGTRIQLWDNLHAMQQKFIIDFDDGYYTIRSKYTGKVLTANVDNTITQEEYKSLDNQKWIIISTGNNIYKIISKANSKLINISDAQNGIKLNLADNNETLNQMFSFKLLKDDGKVLNEGTYVISSVLNKNMALDITDCSLDNGAKIQFWDYLDAEQQKFNLEYTSDGYYIIKSEYSGKVLTVENQISTLGSTITQQDNQYLDTQKWMIRPCGDNEYNIVSKVGFLPLDAPGSNASNGVKLQVWEDNNADAQKFIFKELNLKSNKTIEDGIYEIASSINSNISFDITDGSNLDGAQIQLWDYLGSDQQKFEIKYNIDGYYTIKSKYTGKVLAVQQNLPKQGDIIIQVTEDNNDKRQDWIIEDCGNGEYNIISRCGLLPIDIPGANCTNGVKLQSWENNGNSAQRFIFKEKDVENKSDRVIENGIYEIVSLLDTNKAFDITNGSNEDGTKIQLWDYLNAIQQKFKIEYDSEGFYTIESMLTGKLLATENINVYNGVKLIQKQRDGSDSEKWIIEKNEDGFNIISKKDNFYVDVTNGNANNGTQLQLYESNNTSSQKFKLILKGTEAGIEDGTYRISMSTNASLSFDIDAGKRENGANLQLWDWAGENSFQQQFNFVYNSSDGTYTIYNLNSGKVLDVAGAGMSNYTNVWQYESNNNEAQKWIVLKNDNGSYSIISALNGLYLDIANGQLENGANVQLYEGNGTVAQQFELIKQSSTKAIRFLEDGIYRISTKYNNNIGFDITDGSKEDGAQIQLWDYLNSSQEEFNITYEEGYYYICSNYSGKVIQAGNNYEIITQQTKNTNNDAQKWILQPNNGSYNIISKKTGLYMDVIDANFSNGNKIQTHHGNGNIAQLFDFFDVAIAIDEEKYPGIKERVNELKTQHPNWQFEVLYTGIDFYTAVQGEYEYENRTGNLVDTNVYKGDWIAPNPYVSGNWASASYNGIAYFMDSRNFLNDVDAFQFVDLSDYANSGATIESIQYQVNGTFLNDFAEDVRVSCEHQNVNPYYIIARLFQEQGRNGSITIYMDGGDGKLYYNPFNIGAQVGNDFATALAKAKEQGWDSMQKGIEGGIRFIREGYLDAHQNTLYLNKFDVNPASPGGFYSHQYMQNLSAAYSEARTFRSSYVSTGTLDNKIKFIIPVYENMPATPATRPSGQGAGSGYPTSTDQRPMYVQTFDIQSYLTLRSGPGEQYGKIGELENDKTMISMERYDNGWQKVFLIETGKIGYCSGTYLQFIDDPTNCNDRVVISTNSSVNVRNAPSTNNTTTIASFRNGMTGTRILKDYYYFDGYWWNLVIFDDGTKGFVVSNYLRNI